MNDQDALQMALKSRLETLRIRYPRYSVRAFAKKAGVSPATLSLVLQGNRKVSQKLAQSLSAKLMFDPTERALIFDTLLDTRMKRASKAKGEEYVQLSLDQYRLISDWRAFALLNLISTKGFRNERKWISARLGISESETLRSRL